MTLIEIYNKYSGYAADKNTRIIVRGKLSGVLRMIMGFDQTKMTFQLSYRDASCSGIVSQWSEYANPNFDFCGYGNNFSVTDIGPLDYTQLLGKVTVDKANECTCELYGPKGLMAIGCTCGHTKKYSNVG